ncbi:SDR family oxidoreductase [Nocardioides bizhenqiangii]|uniref:SDR family oxidoreductase n=1 Tax=Nocardioides bizhenqiangii TaxID=3095076 RepID=A0ABZ0ZV41_9ACTN|nr:MULTISPECIES: SDR family oxidoreductase [unclassified Nocardioides]MDZ5623366.1 SDR family oxidoreductase [Nocardioides sp. HM23]WQQ27691.1 SDR family oxidoreductase [Nocardioides sp. HM61]
MRVAIVGGHGQIARHLHPLLVAAGDRPVALVRSESHRAELEAASAEVRLLDIEREDADAFGRAFDGCEAVVFAAGGGPDGNKERKRTVDLEGSLKSIEGAGLAGIRRFVQVSAIDVDRPVADDTSDVWRAYVEAKRDADAALRSSDLDWTIIRPGRLTDEAPTGLVALGPEVSRASIPRADVAAVLAAVLDRSATIGHQWNLVSGETPVAEAINRAASR